MGGNVTRVFGDGVVEMLVLVVRGNRRGSSVWLASGSGFMSAFSGDKPPTAVDCASGQNLVTSLPTVTEETSGSPLKSSVVGELTEPTSCPSLFLPFPTLPSLTSSDPAESITSFKGVEITVGRGPFVHASLVEDALLRPMLAASVLGLEPVGRARTGLLLRFMLDRVDMEKVSECIVGSGSLCPSDKSLVLSDIAAVCGI